MKRFRPLIPVLLVAIVASVWWVRRAGAGD